MTVATDLHRGRVILVGAGPGDPEHLTLKAVRALEQADVILHDSLIDRGVLGYAQRTAVVVDVGKRGGRPSTPQPSINALMIEHARAGRIVVRLKGGDAFVFGRAAEEIAAVEAEGIAIDIVPGITAAQACAVDARLPLTYRGEVRQISLVTGASIDGAPDLDWDALARPGQALAIYMGVGNAHLIGPQLIAAGACPAMPVVIVENGGLPQRRTIATTLDDLETAIAACDVRGPAILFVGLHWSDAGLRLPAHVEVFQAIETHRSLRKPVGARSAPRLAHITIPLPLAGRGRGGGSKRAADSPRPRPLPVKGRGEEQSHLS